MGISETDVAQRLRRTGRQSAQRGILELCRDQPLAFAVAASTAASYLAKAAIADHDPRYLFRKPGQLSDRALRLLREAPSEPVGDPATAMDLLPEEDRVAARRELLGRRSINGPQAITVLRKLGLPNRLDVEAATTLFEVRSQGVELTVADGLDEFTIAALDVVEAVWSSPDRSVEALWGSFGDAVAALRGPDPDGLAWSTARRVALARDRHAALAATSAPMTGSTGEDDEWVTCPVCLGDAVLRRSTGPVPPEVQLWTSGTDTIVLTCAVCALELFGEAQLRQVGIAAPRSRAMGEADAHDGPSTSARSLLQMVRRPRGSAATGPDDAELATQVSRRLERLGEDWFVMQATAHGGIRHLLLGQQGAFLLSTTQHRGSRVLVEELQILVDGQATSHLGDARFAADEASSALSRAFGRPIVVSPAVVIDGQDDLAIERMPADVHVTTVKGVVRWLRSHAVAFSVADARMLVALARMSSTWSEAP
ncbi:hypothetical protein [Euzebya tangerina]|uniref:hypothetical protein n=1 Tax=Euzebya tangerina TaxID=591198 RepID=UPI000E319562|nr:hypothetical protein [Euzebya tangerina]